MLKKSVAMRRFCLLPLLPLAAFAALMAFISCSNTYTIRFYAIDDDLLSDTYGDYKLITATTVPKGSYLARFDDSVLSSAATGWYYGPMLHDLDSRLTADNIENVKKEMMASEFVPERYGSRRMPNPTRISGNYNLYACYGEKVTLTYHYFNRAGDAVTATVENIKNSSIDEASIPQDIMTNTVEIVGDIISRQYCSVGYAYLADGSVSPAGTVDKANASGEYKDSYSQIRYFSDETASMDLDIYVLYGERMEVRIYEWSPAERNPSWNPSERNYAGDKYIQEASSEKGIYKERSNFGIGRGGSLSSTLEPHYPGCVGWWAIRTLGSFDSLFATETDAEGRERKRVLSDILKSSAGISSYPYYMPNSGASGSSFSFGAGDEIEENIAIFPIFADDITIGFKWFNGHYVIGDDGEGRVPDFSFKEILKADGVAQNGETNYTAYLIECNPEDGYEIYYDYFPNKVSSGVSNPNTTANKINGYLSLTDLNIPWGFDKIRNVDTVWDSATADERSPQEGQSMDTYGVLRRDSIWDARAEETSSAPCKYPRQDDGDGGVRWGQILYAGSAFEPKYISQCMVEGVSLVRLQEVNPSNAYLKVIPESYGQTVYLYAISEIYVSN